MDQKTHKWRSLVWCLAWGTVLFLGCGSALEAAGLAAGTAGQTGPAAPALQAGGPKSASPEGTDEGPMIKVTEGDKISASAKNRPLSEVLRIMSQKNLFDIRGPLPSGESITVDFSGLTLEQALGKLMRGYNYVLMDQGASRKPILTVMGPIVKGASAGESPSPQTPQPVKNRPPAPGSPNVPPPPPQEGQPQPAAQRTGPAVQPGPAPAPQPGPAQTPPSPEPGAQQGAPQQPGPAPAPPPPELGAQQGPPQQAGPAGATNIPPKPEAGATGQPPQQPEGQAVQSGEGIAPGKDSVDSTLPKGF